MIKNCRNLTVYNAKRGTHFQSIPQIRLQGDWLKASGFAIGDNIQVDCKKNQIVITKSNEKSTMTIKS